METFTLFGQTGRALFGSHWQSDLARALKVNLRTVRRWGAGQEEPPSGVWRELEEITITRTADLARLVDEIRNRSAFERVIPAVIIAPIT